jgi:threonine synthase
MVATLDPGSMRFPDSDHSNPVVRHRTFLHTYRLARALGATDAQYVDVVGRLDAAVVRVDGRGFAVTPFGRSVPLSERLGFSPQGGVWVKDENGNVAGSRKARHLMGLAVHLTLMEQVGMSLTSPRQG